MHTHTHTQLHTAVHTIDKMQYIKQWRKFLTHPISYYFCCTYTWLKL